MDDERGFAAFYRDHREHLYRAVAVTLGDVRLAEEAVDEAFTRAAERWSQVGAFGRPAGWVYRVAVNWATSWRRKLSGRPTRPAEELDRAHHDRLPDVDLHAELAALNRQQRELLVLRYALGLSVEETAQVLGIAEGTVKSRVHRSLAMLRDTREVSDGRA